jgi:hypothetical protein
METHVVPRPRTTVLAFAVLAALTFGCLKADNRPASQGASPAGERRPQPGEIAPGYVAVDRVAPMALPSVAQPPPPLATVDPASLEPAQPESFVPASGSGR